MSVGSSILNWFEGTRKSMKEVINSISRNVLA